ncbi:MAG: hypothetical protein Q8S31_07370 [Alphaproteobacteria bacterium]|nr:hypothetical protein [Alphaproteobacteria bacterium]
MKKLVFLVAICLLPNLVIAEGKWPIFSNQEGAEQSLENLMVIGANSDKGYLIGSYEYTITSFTCNALIDEANKDKSAIAEFRPGEILAEEGTTYNLYIGDVLVEDTETVIKRHAASEEEKVEIPLDTGNSNGVEDDTDAVKKPAGKKGFCNLL